jgi:hypothetical protein
MHVSILEEKVKVCMLECKKESKSMHVSVLEGKVKVCMLEC